MVTFTNFSSSAGCVEKMKYILPDVYNNESRLWWCFSIFDCLGFSKRYFSYYYFWFCFCLTLTYSIQTVIVPHRIIWNWYSGHCWVGCCIGTARGLGGAAARPSPPRCTKCNSPPSVPVTVLLCDGPLLCSFNVGIKGLTSLHLWNYFAGFCKEFLVDLLVALANKHRQNMERRCVLLVIKPRN